MSDVDERPRFYEHQYLEAADLGAVVTYSRDQLARTNLGAHRWGIASGLDLVEVPAPGGAIDVVLQPGYAWDGFGRAIVVGAPYRLTAALFAGIDAEFVTGNPPRAVEIWLSYDETATRGPRPGFEDCANTNAFARVMESFRVEVGSRSTVAQQRSPISIAGRTVDAAQALKTFDAGAAELVDASVPHQSLPAEGDTMRWLVPVGVVSWAPGNPAGKFVARDDALEERDARSRQYSGPIGGSLEAVGGHIKVHDRLKPYSTAFTPDELLWVEGALRVDGATRLYGNGVEFIQSHGESPRVPFHLLRRDDVTGKRFQAVIGDANAGENRFSIGRKTGDDAYAEDFVVTDNGRVGIGTTQPKAPLHLTEDGLQIGTSSNAIDNFHIKSDTDGGPRGLRVYNKDFGAGAPVATITQTGRLGIGTNDPTHPVHVNGDLGLRQNSLYLSGGTGQWSSIAYNAHRSADGASWVFPDTAQPAVTIEMDTADAGAGRFEVWSTTKVAPAGWLSRFKVFGDTGNIGMALSAGNVGIGTYTPGAKLDVNGEVAFAGGMSPVAASTRTRTVWGRVNNIGSVADGTGFAVNKLGPGRYEIAFTVAFLSPPAVIVTRVWESFEFDAGTAVKPHASAIVDRIQPGSAIVATANDAGLLTDANFCFVVMGSR